jgi:outer membrane protein assembly factor BamB
MAGPPGPPPLKDLPAPHHSHARGGTLQAGPRRGPSGGPFQFRRPPLRILVWTAGALVLVVVLALLWRISDARATSSTTAARSGPITGTPDANLSEAWSAVGDPVPPQVVQDGRVIVGSRHGISALDPATGREVWHYTRSNARMCGLTATDGVIVAVYAKGASLCDQAVALRADTGVRAWNRNVDFRPDARLISTTGSVLAVAPTGVVDLDPNGDNIRWRYHAPAGCRLADVRAGSAGMALLQRCASASAPQLRLLDGITGRPVWTRDVPEPQGGAVRLAGADAVVSVVAGDELLVLAAGDGAPLDSSVLPGDPDAGIAAETEVAGVVLVWTHGTVLAVDHTSGRVTWSRPALGLPGVQLGSGASAGAVLVPEEGAFVARDAVTGAETGRSAVPDLASGGTTAGVGPTVVYRLPDRVLGYR